MQSNQLKLFDETTYPDPNPFKVGDLIGNKYRNKKYIIEEINDKGIITIYDHFIPKSEFDDFIPKSELKDWVVIRKNQPELFRFKDGQEVWWDGICPCIYIFEGNGKYTLENNKSTPKMIKIYSIYTSHDYGHIYNASVFYIYPEHLFEKEQ